jgi:hypothetical protein
VPNVNKICLYVFLEYKIIAQYLRYSVNPYHYGLWKVEGVS